MERLFEGRRISLFIAVCAIALFCVSCKKEFAFESQGTLTMSFSSDYKSSTMNKFKEQLSKAGVMADIPDTNLFVLKIVNSFGNTIFYDSYQDRPEKFQLNPGTYEVTVFSSILLNPEFDMPVYGDTQTIYMEHGGYVNLEFNCKQLNSGIRINYSEVFRERYIESIFQLKSDEDSIQYGLNETRIAFFNPGRVSLHMYKQNENLQLLSRLLNIGEILTINLTCTPLPYMEDKISITIDTTRVWINEDVFLSDPGNGTSKEKAYSVSEARYKIGEQDVWVKGYIVGTLTTSSGTYEAPFTVDTNIAIADSNLETDKQYMIGVSLPQGAIRDALNLSTNEGNLRKEVYFKGNIEESYLGTIGLKNIDEYYIE